MNLAPLSLDLNRGLIAQHDWLQFHRDFIEVYGCGDLVLAVDRLIPERDYVFFISQLTGHLRVSTLAWS